MSATPTPTGITQTSETEATMGLSAAPRPTVGRIVHYVLPHGSRHVGEHRAAVIAQVWNDQGLANLSVFKGQSSDFDFPMDGPKTYPIAESDTHTLLGSVSYSDERLPGTWHWPERG